MIPTDDPDIGLGENNQPEDIWGEPVDMWYVRERLREKEDEDQNHRRS